MIKLLNPIMRFEGWEPYGLFKRKPDTRTVEEIKASIEAWSRKVPDVKQILPELKSMNPKHLGLVADTIELSQKPATTYMDVDLTKVDEEFYSFYSPLDKLMATFPLISKKNPNAMTFTQEVIDQTGKLMSKFFLKAAGELDFLLDDGVDKNFKKGIPLIERFAKDALNTPLERKNPFSRQEEFMGRVLTILDEDADVEKIALLDDVYKTIGTSSCYDFDILEFIKSSTPMDVIKENLKTLKSKLSYGYSFGKIVDVNEHLSKDIQIK